MAFRYYNLSINFKKEGQPNSGSPFSPDENVTKSHVIKLDTSGTYSTDQGYLSKIHEWMDTEYSIFSDSAVLGKTSFTLNEIRTDLSPIQYRLENSHPGNYDIEIGVENVNTTTGAKSFRKDYFYKVAPLNTMMNVYLSTYLSAGDRISSIRQVPTSVIEI